MDSIVDIINLCLNIFSSEDIRKFQERSGGDSCGWRVLAIRVSGIEVPKTLQNEMNQFDADGKPR